MIRALIAELTSDVPILIAGPTASGKSALALAIADALNATVLNADASQVYACWRVITARPSADEETRVPHALYGHVAYDARYSAGHWAREVTPFLDGRPLVIVGGTGLYFSALTDGLSKIPETPAWVRAQADAMSLDAMHAQLDAETLSRIDPANRARVQRAWEVHRSTGRPLSVWQNAPTKPLLPNGGFQGIVLDSPKDWLTPRIAARFEQMLDAGGLDEAAAMRDRFDPALPSCRAIGVKEAMGVLNGDLTRAEAVEAATIATRQYAKRQRTWFRVRMEHWRWIEARALLSA